MISRKQVLFILAIALASNSCSNKGNWKVDKINSGSTLHSSTRISSLSNKASNQIHLEIFKLQEGTRGYIFSKSHPIPCFEQNPTQTALTIKTDDEILFYLGARHEGGQRILLPPDALEKIISSLKNGISITIEVPGAETTLNPKGFPKDTKKLSFFL